MDLSMYKKATIDVMSAAVLLDNLEDVYANSKELLERNGRMIPAAALLVTAYENLEKAWKEAK